MAKENKRQVKGVDNIKLKYLRDQLKTEKIKKPNRDDVQRIIEVGYVQAGNYLKALRQK